MKRAPLLASLTLALAASATAQRAPMPPAGHEGGAPSRRAYANPSAGIAADIERARLTGGKKGRWSGLRETAAPDAVMFVPEMVLAQPWLKARSDYLPGYGLRPLHAWASCDGSLIVTSGARRDRGSDGWYTTVWQRQPAGVYRWVFDHGGPLEMPLTESEMIEARVAECPPMRSRRPVPVATNRRGKPPPVVFDPASRRGSSDDGSLSWQVTMDPDGSHRFSAALRVNGEMRVFRDEKVAPGAP